MPPIAPQSGQCLRAAAPLPTTTPCRLPQCAFRPNPKQRTVASISAAIRTAGVSGSGRITEAVPALGARDQGLLTAHGITSVADLESIHFDLHLADGHRTRQFLQDVVGINDDAAVRGVLQFLGAEDAHLTPYSPLRHADALLDVGQEASIVPPSPLPQGTSSRPAPTMPQRNPRGVSAAPTRSTPVLPARSPSRLSPAPLSPARNLQPASSRYSGATAMSQRTEESGLEELARYETQILDLLQNYSGLTLERLDGLLYMSGKEPKYTQGIARLQLLLDAMCSQGTVKFEDGAYRFQRRTPEPERAYQSRSSSPSSRNGRSNSAGSPRPASGSPRPAASRSPGARAPAPRVYAEPVDLSGYESRVLDVLRKYEGLPLERLNNMLSMSPGEPRYEASPEQLEPYLATLLQQGKVLMDKNVYKYNAYFSRRNSSNPRSSSPQGSRRPVTPAPSMGDINSYSPAVLDLLQSYAGLTLDRLDSLLESSPKAVGYRSSPRQLGQLLNRLVQEGRIFEADGLYSYRPRSPTMSRSKSPTAMRGASAGSPSRGRKTSSPQPPARMMDIAFYEPAVLDLLQSYAGLTLDRLDSLLIASPRAPGYVRSPVSLQGLLTQLQSQGRVTNDNGLYRYRTTGKTPQIARAKSPPNSTRAASPMGAGALDSVRRALSQGLSSASAAAAPRAGSPMGSMTFTNEDWSAYEGTVTTMLGNYGALPLDRLHEMLKMSMVWPRYDRSPAQLASYLASLVASGRIAQENGLYRMAGTAAPARMAQTYTSTPSNVARYEGLVLSTLAAYPGLTVERLNNMIKLSKAPAGADLNEDSLSQLMSSLVSQGKVSMENGLYKVTGSAGSNRPAPPAVSSTSTTLPSFSTTPVMSAALSGEQMALLDRLGFPTQDGLSGFVPFAEVWNGRWAMLGFAASIPVEIRTGSGTLEQLGFQGLPSMELFDILLWGSVALVGLGSAITAVRFATGIMPPKEKNWYERLASREPQGLEQADKFYTDELAYARKAEITNGRAAMAGFLASILMEALTGRGIVGQAALYLKLLGILGEDSGF